ncbi:hypothetical protein MD484_g8705, partial [Candolleomyces efflorescens]
MSRQSDATLVSTPSILRLANETLIQIFDCAVHLPVLAGPVTVGSAQPTSTLYDELTHFAPTRAQAPPQTEGGESEGDGYRPFIASHATNRTTPLMLSHVCKDWRRLTFSAPELWATIHIRGTSPGLLNILEKVWLPNSGNRLLDLTLQAPNRCISYMMEPSIKGILEALGRQSARWKSLTIQFDWLLPTMHRFLRPVEPADQLHSLCFRPNLWNSKRSVEFVKRSMGLRQVEFYERDHSHQDWDLDCARTLRDVLPASLTTLKIHLALEGNPLLFSILSRFQSLENLDVTFIVISEFSQRNAGDLGRLEEAIVHLPVLKQFTLIGTHGSHRSLIPLLNCLEAPALSDLSIRTGFPAGGDRSLAGTLFTSLKEMLKRSKVALRTFAFVDANNDFHLYPLLMHPSMTTVEELEVRSTQMSVLLERLKIEDSETPIEWIPVPNLVHLRLALYDYRPAVCGLSKMVKTRQGLSPLVRKIRSVEATFSIRDHLEFEREFWGGQPELEKVERWFYYRSE